MIEDKRAFSLQKFNRIQFSDQHTQFYSCLEGEKIRSDEEIVRRQ